MNKITHRQNLILEFIRENGPSGNKEVLEYLIPKIGELDRATTIRDINNLIKNGLVVREGEGRYAKYREDRKNIILTYFDSERYFEKKSDQRNLLNERFNFDVFDYFTNDIFFKKEIKDLDKLNDDYVERIKKISPTLLKKEFERLTIELSWKSSQIEGNTYSLIDTEILIKQHKLAKNHTKEEAQMILNHKEALDYIIANKDIFKKMTLAKIENIHQLLVSKMGISPNIRKSLVGVIGTKYMPLDNSYQIKEAMDKLILILNKKQEHPLLKALASVLLISYIQPFEDGNKRTARLVGNAVLLANNYCPLSFRSVDDSDYKKATLLFYEQNSARFFKELFIDQFKFGLDHYFLTSFK